MSGGKLWQCILDPRSPRYAEWFAILNTREVPLEDAHTYWANLGAEKDVEIHRLDISALNPGQLIRLIEWICVTFNEDDRDLVENELKKTGFPIRAADVILSFSLRAFL